jgi:hypothetical protein
MSTAKNFRFCTVVVQALRSCAATTGGQGQLTYFMHFSRFPVEAALSSFNLGFLLKTTFAERIDDNERDCHQCRITNFLKMYIFKRTFGQTR